MVLRYGGLAIVLVLTVMCAARATQLYAMVTEPPGPRRRRRINARLLHTVGWWQISIGGYLILLDHSSWPTAIAPIGVGLGMHAQGALSRHAWWTRP